MPERRKRAGLYIRESDLTLSLDSITIESAINALVEHAQRKGYELDRSHIWIETISGYHTYYFDRPELMKALKAAEQGEFDVFLVTEIRALSRRGAGEVLVIYNILQKANVQLETLTETITDDPMGEVLLTFRATWARIEREQSFVRMQRGKSDRIKIGQAPPNGKTCYGFVLVDTEKETKGRYEFNEKIIHVDRYGKEWSEIKVRKYILDHLIKRETLRSVSTTLNDLGVPPPRKGKKSEGCWTATTIRRIAEQTINYGDFYVNRYKRMEKQTKDGKRKMTLVKRPKEDWTLLTGIAPALITKEVHAEIMENMALNKAESIRNNQHAEELGLLRGGYIFCGVCGKRMSVRYASSRGAKRPDPKPPFYRCIRREGVEQAMHNHCSTIYLKKIDTLVKEKIIEALSQPEKVRAKVAAIRTANTPIVNEAEIHETVADLKQKIKNLYKLAENATDDENIMSIAERMNELERQKRETERLIYVLEDDAEDRKVIEEELQKFETWAAKVQPFLTDATYMTTATYTELRLALKILGIRVIVYPTKGDWPFRYQIDVTIPEILAKMGVDYQSSLLWPVVRQML